MVTMLPLASALSNSASICCPLGEARSISRSASTRWTKASEPSSFTPLRPASLLSTTLTTFGSAVPVPVSLSPTPAERSEEHTSELQSLMRIYYAVFCLNKKNIHTHNHKLNTHTQYT